MKAIIMAGGEGTRLRPLSCGVPKPMVQLLDRPVMEHILALLRRNGITEVAATLMYMPEAVREYFGDGSGFGTQIEYFVEDSPLGTAGSVRQCAQFIGNEDFLVISGDCVCDFDLTAAYQFHREKDADVTIVLYRHPEPLEYGLVLTEPDGRIVQFVEKPSWGQVFSDAVNTGIYIIKPRVLQRIPRNRPFDFAADLFPMLLGGGARLFGCTLQGSWCDMGDCGAYLDCAMDALSKKLRLDMGLAERRPGIWSHEPLRDDIKITAPCYLGAGARIQGGAELGPGAVISGSAVIGAGAQIKNSVVMGVVGDFARLDGAITDRGARIGRRAELRQGSVAGAGAFVGDNAVVCENVRIWPGRNAGGGRHIKENLISGDRGDAAHFDGNILRVPENGFSPEFLSLVGAVCAQTAGRGGIAVGAGNHPFCQMAAAAISSGAAGTGGGICEHDASSAAEAAWITRFLGAELGLYASMQNEDEPVLYVFDKHGLPPKRPLTRKLESLLSRGEITRMPAGLCGTVTRLNGITRLYAGRAAASGRAAGCPVRIAGLEGFDTLTETLRLAGVSFTNRPAPGFGMTEDGFGLILRDEENRSYDAEHSLAVIALCHFLEYPGSEIAVPYDAPSALDIIAAERGGSVRRIERDGNDTRLLYAAQGFLSDACHGAVKLCSYLAQSGRTLSSIVSLLPAFSVHRRSINCQGDKGRLMRAMTESLGGMKRELVEGIRVSVDGGWVRISPSVTNRRLDITAEGFNEEIAEELCAEFVQRAEDMDEGQITDIR